jgi:hypothetical protein
MVCMCVLAYSYFSKNPLTRSWLTTRLSRWGCYSTRARASDPPRGLGTHGMLLPVHELPASGCLEEHAGQVKAKNRALSGQKCSFSQVALVCHH